MKRTSDSTTSSTSSTDNMDAWQQWQASFRPSKRTCLLEDDSIDQAVQQHMSLTPVSVDDIPEEALEFLPLRNNKRSGQESHDELATSSALPLVPLRRDHSSGGALLRN
ncbi:expressed unknown protein [Seminavis robusta]|uniref:Uncharacterized protein n=1 Tax=Seminavis robusta TaxID=568900 RepID=A0A9N8ESI5_9STRA|nr:expressed unknown protein [Seminavis robusta]|eukprot:Sro1651_g288750.1 n/a (109) ;mRNA; f:15557-15883